MSLLQQLMSYLSQPPDSTVYHIVTLLALQATLGLAWWQVRRRPDDDFARRLVWASGAILFSRLLILLVLFATSGLVEAISLLPPLERAVDALTVAILVWALTPRSNRFPRLGSALLLILLIVIGFLYIAFAGEWRQLVAAGLPADVGYADTQQATIWNILVIALLAIGGSLVTYARESQWSLRLSVLILLLIAQGISLFLGDSLSPPNVEVSVWTRLGNVIAFPTLAVLAARHSLHGLLPAGQMGRSAVVRLAQSLELSGSVSESLLPSQTLEAALRMALTLLPGHFAAIARASEERPAHFNVIARTSSPLGLSPENVEATRSWPIERDDRSALSQALRDGQQIELLSDGQGARQFHELRHELKLERRGAVLIQPLVAAERITGLLIMARGPSPAFWSDDEKNLAKALGAFLGKALENARRYQLVLAGRAPDFERELAELRGDLEGIARRRDQALDQVDALNEQVTQLSDQLSIAQERLGVDDQKLRETTLALAQAVERQQKVNQLEQELAGLHDALSEAELALANAAAGEAGLSTEWVMRTVTRYSGELEEAQAHINALEKRLSQPDGQELAEQAVAVTRRLKTPLTALGGYTDLMLDRAAGELSAQQESLLRRMRVNVDNMALTIDSLSGSTRFASPGPDNDTLIHVHETLEQAIYAVSSELQFKKLKVDVCVDEGLPSLEDPANSLNELFVQLLSAACLASAPDGRLYISARRISGNDEIGEASESAGFLRVTIADDGGARSHALYAETVLEQGGLPDERSSSSLPKLARYLQSASLIASSNGGRSWLDVAHPKGSKLILLLPFTSSGPGASI
jgi:GAF domain-containing protein